MNQSHAFLSLMQGKYSEIRDIEMRHQIFGHEGDYRPRIEYYHDAVRALASPADDGLTKDSRLSIERLAYDAEMLRLITARPLVVGRGEQHYSTSDALVVTADAGDGLHPDRRTKQQLSDAYRDYTVFFIAMMAESAEDNVKARKDENDVLIQDCHRLETMLTQLAAGGIDIATVIKAAMLIEHDGLRRKILALLNQGKPNRDELNSASNSVRDARNYFNAEQKTLDAAGMRFSTSQLMVYEASKDTIKQLSSQGLNVAGKFMKQSLDGQGQGRGTTRGV
jgi:hypothetical protein